MYNIDKKYGVPIEEIACPGCGQKYGHHKTKVCSNCSECSKCCGCLKRSEKQNLWDADEFIKNVLGYQPVIFK